MFVDRIKIYAEAGDGGNGCVSFRREKFVPRGGPDGGDGGRGGDVILRVDTQIDDLVAFHYQPQLRAGRGAHGQGSKKRGRNGGPIVVGVPPGTLVYRRTALEGVGNVVELPPEDEVGEPVEGLPVELGLGGRGRPGDEPLELVADLCRTGEEFVLCQGGDGGKGNVHFKSSTNRVPRQCTPGYPGERGHFLLELRMIADAGLVGYPNAGKSSLLRQLSAARPKVAPYPFTTLHPVVGVVEMEGYRRVTVADIPGLIEGAHRNAGLGHDFLRHIVRCRRLLFVLDMAGSEGRSPAEDLVHLREELRLYDPSLLSRESLVVANKIDLPEAAEHLAELRRLEPDLEVFPVSALVGDGVVELCRWLATTPVESEEGGESGNLP